MNHTCHTIKVRHQTIAQLVVGHDSLVSLVVGRCDVPYLAGRPLAVGAVEGNEAAELVPAGLQLAPFLEVGVLVACLVKLLLGCHITVLHAEASLVHAPEGMTCQGKVQTCRHLGTHILPTGGDVSRPSGGAVTLLAGETGTGQEEYPLVGVHRALTVIDGIGIHDAVGIEVLCGGAEGGRTAECLAVPHRGTVADVRLGGIHPPGIDALLVLGVEVFVHLSPEHLAGSCIVGIIERTAVAEPVVDVVGDCLVIHPSLAVEFLVVLGGVVELGPYGDHEPAVHAVYTVEHCLWVGIAGSFEVVTTPRVDGPVVPVLYDVVHWDMEVAELLEVALDVLAALITLTALPETEHPLGIDGSLAGEGAVTADHLVGVLTGDEVVVHVGRHLAPDAQLVLLSLRAWSGNTQTAVGHVTIGLPFDADGGLHTLADGSLKLIGVGVPCRTPTLGYHELAVDVNLHVAGIVEDKLVETVGGCLNISLVHHLGTVQGKALGQVLDAAVVGLPAKLGSLGHGILEVDAVLATHNLLSVLIYICTRELSCLAVLVVELEGTVELQVVVGLSPTAERIRIPEDTVVLVGNHEGNAHLGIVLEEVLVLALHVEFLALVLAQTIESLVVGRVEDSVPRPSVFLCLGHLGDVHAHLIVGYGERLEGLSALCHLVEQHIALEVVEGDVTGGLAEHGTHGDSGDDEVIALLLHLIVGLAGLGHDDEALLVLE